MIPVHLDALGPVTELATGTHWSGAELREQVLRRAAAMAAEGVGPGTRVLLLHGNSAAFLADLFAVWQCGAAAACADAEVGPADLASMTDTLEPALVVTRHGVPDRLRDAVGEARLLVSGTSGEVEDAPVVPRSRPDDAALLLFTSGSTGLPKGVVHTVRSLTSKWAGLRHHVPLERCATTLCALPTHFGHGLICNALYPLVHGCHLVLSPRLDIAGAARLGEVLDTHGVTFMSSVPAMWRLILQLSGRPQAGTLQQVHIGSAPLSAELWQAVIDWTGTPRVWNTYGITETGSWVAGPVDDPEPTPIDGLIGRGWNADVLLVPTDSEVTSSRVGSIAAVPDGEVGRVLLRTPDLMAGYLDRDEETAGVVHGTWFDTGDLGTIDEQGRLLLVGRVRNEINKGGIKISPEEIDLVVERHADVAEACAFRVPDALLGEDLEIAVVARPGSELTARTVTSWVASQLAAAKVPRRVHVVESIPKTARGKVNREQVAAACQTLRP
jgi:oxalate---CoA ligase